MGWTNLSSSYTYALAAWRTWLNDEYSCVLIGRCQTWFMAYGLRILSQVSCRSIIYWADNEFTIQRTVPFRHRDFAFHSYNLSLWRYFFSTVFNIITINLPPSYSYLYNLNFIVLFACNFTHFIRCHVFLYFRAFLQYIILLQVTSSEVCKFLLKIYAVEIRI